MRKGLIPRVIKLEQRNDTFNRFKGHEKTLDIGILGVFLSCNLQQMLDLFRRYRFGIRRRVDIFFRGNYKSVAVVCSPPTETAMRSAQQERELHVIQKKMHEIQNRTAGVGVVVNQSNIHYIYCFCDFVYIIHVVWISEFYLISHDIPTCSPEGQQGQNNNIKNGIP